MTKLSRRAFLAGSAATFAGASGALGGILQNKAWAADTGGYKALVCIFLNGGMDCHDTILPADRASYDLLRNERQGIFAAYNSTDSSSSRHIDNLVALPLPPGDTRFGSRKFALPRELSGLADAYRAGDLAVVGNVGPLLEPTSRQDIENDVARLPSKLFSHNDQRSTWQSLDAEGAQFGWGGRFADAAIASDPSSNPIYAAIAANGNDVFLVGNAARQYRVPTEGGPLRVNVTRDSSILGNDRRFDTTRGLMADYFEQADFESGNLFERDLARVKSDGVVNARDFERAAGLTTNAPASFPATSMGQQLNAVAQTIDIRGGLNVNRQVFYVSVGGWDTHSDQAATLPSLHAELSEAMSIFRQTMIDRGLWEQVAVFTASDFGRSMTDNGDGSDHGWGGHHFVMGGSVRGGRIYGDLPAPIPSGPDFMPSRGRLIPSTSVEQYAATLGRWFGLNDAELTAALPNLASFSGSDVGFMRR